MRAQEWDEPKAPYPNLWHAGMPRRILAFGTVASRLRLGDLVAVYYPQSQKHPDRSERALGLSRVTALSQADDPKYAWVDLHTAHRLERPLAIDPAPRRVFLCCDPEWPENDVAVFLKVFDAAVAEGFEPLPEETEQGAPRPERKPRVAAEPSGTPPDPRPVAAPVEPVTAPMPGERLFAGAVISADLRDRRDGCWLAVVRLSGDALELLRLEAMDRGTLHGRLRDPDPQLMQTEATGLGFPLGVPLPFCERLCHGAALDQGWRSLVHRIERISLPDYLVAVQEHRDDAGESRRCTDEVAGTPSPLQRSDPDLASMAYHGIKMIGEERSRYAIRPFERAKARLLLEVSPGIAAGQLTGEDSGKTAAVLDAVQTASMFAVAIGEGERRRCHGRRAALDAVLAARAAAQAVISGEADRPAEDLHATDPDRLGLEVWIYGLGL
jgi:hypothetical protein